MMIEGYTAMPSSAWALLEPLVVSAYTATKTEWPEQLVTLHLRWLLGEVWVGRMRPSDFPTVRDLARLWVWSTGRADRFVRNTDPEAGGWQDTGRRLSLAELRGERSRTPPKAAAAPAVGQTQHSAGQPRDTTGHPRDSAHGPTPNNGDAPGQDGTTAGRDGTTAGQECDSRAASSARITNTNTIMKREGPHAYEARADLVVLGDLWGADHARLYAHWRRRVPAGKRAPEECPLAVRPGVRRAVTAHGLEAVCGVIDWLCDSDDEGATFFRKRVDLQVLEVILAEQRLPGRVQAAAEWRARPSRTAAGATRGALLSGDRGVAEARRRGHQEGEALAALRANGDDVSEVLEEVSGDAATWGPPRGVAPGACAEAYAAGLKEALGAGRAHG